MKSLKAIDQLEHVQLVIAITVRKIAKKIITKMDFRYQTDAKNKAKNVCLVRKIYFSY